MVKILFGVCSCPVTFPQILYLLLVYMSFAVEVNSDSAICSMNHSVDQPCNTLPYNEFRQQQRSPAQLELLGTRIILK